MFSLGLLLHLHQPPTQFPEILKLVVDQSYRPLLRLLAKHPQARLTLNITGSLLEELDHRGYPDVISSLAGLVHQCQVEVTGSSIYHALLPRIPETEAIRQITLNELALDKYLGVIGPILNGEQRTDKQTVPENGVRSTDKQINGEKNPEILQDPLLRSSGLRSPLMTYVHPSSVLAGFFPPEMGIDDRTARLIANLGYQWAIVDESAVEINRHCDPPAGPLRPASPNRGERKASEAGESAGRYPSPSLRAERSNLNDSSGQAPQSRIATASLPADATPQALQAGGLAMMDGNIKIVVRNKDLSLRIAFGVITTLHDFLAAAKPYSLNANRSLILAMDGETFGHHQPKLLPFLDDLMKNSGGNDYRLVTVSELIRGMKVGLPNPKGVSIRSSTWSGGWERWADPGNEIHEWQWQLTDLAIKTVNGSRFVKNIEGSDVIARSPRRSNLLKIDRHSASRRIAMTTGELRHDSHFSIDEATLSSEQKQWLKARTLLDRALHSDQYWWAAGRPNWHYKLVERGARMLKEVVETVPDASESSKKAAGQLYQSITLTGLKKYGDTVIV